MTNNATTPSIEDLQRELQGERDRNARLTERAERLQALAASSKKKAKKKPYESGPAKGKTRLNACCTRHSAYESLQEIHLFIVLYGLFPRSPHPSLL